jgi:small subunit ribosomal protein S21
LIYVSKKENERPEALLRRFNRLVQESGLLKNVKEHRFFTKPPTRRARRESAQRKMMIKKIKEGI